jgi:hypothetical protein
MDGDHQWWVYVGDPGVWCLKCGRQTRSFPELRSIVYLRRGSVVIQCQVTSIAAQNQWVLGGKGISTVCAMAMLDPLTVSL